ncbi:DEAD-domain-containing protein [Atractiella rhizophila]|nr:DEAD-domain-containing protein [Atractiella rhizophila]
MAAETTEETSPNTKKRKRDHSEEATTSVQPQKGEKALTAAKKRYLKRKKERTKAKRQVKKAELKKKSTSDTNQAEQLVTTELRLEVDSSKKDSKKRKRDKKSKAKDGNVQEGPLDDEEWERKQKEDIAKRKEEKRRKRELRRLQPPETTQEQQAEVSTVPAVEVDGESEEESEEESSQSDEDQSPSVTQMDKEPPKPLLRLPPPRRPTPVNQTLITTMAIDPSLADENALIVPASREVEQGELRELGLEEKLMEKLKDSGIESFFQVQEVVIPLLLSKTRRQRDLLVSAPTGSGKTLAYALPIVQTLSPRIVTRLRALIVVPTRDLVTQVRETFETFTRGTGLKIGSVTGQNSFAQEQRAIVHDTSKPQLGGCSKVDILIATPGRLLDHLNQTPNLTLQHLSFLVIDEADRLLNQSFQDWLAAVLRHLEPPTTLNEMVGADGPLAGSWRNVVDALEETGVRPKRKASTQKLLFSATLSRDPTKIEALELNDPLYVAIKEDNETEGVPAAEESFSLPSTLEENMIITVSTSKPLMLFHLLYNHQTTQALCFTKSVSSATRLVKLVKFFEDISGLSSGQGIETIRSYSSDLASSERAKILASFKEGRIRLLVCSDLIARGIDLPQVDKVISYDVPIDIRKYVHRVGRTARAGKKGEAWTLVESQEAAFFKEMMVKHGRHGKVKKVRIKKEDINKFEGAYESALEKLKDYFVGTGGET